MDVKETDQALQFERIVTTPSELIKIRQQSLLFPTTARRVALQIFREAGIIGLYRGITATALRDSSYGAYFAAVRAFHDHKARAPLLTVLT